jgi:hypothetical protein
VTRGQKIVVVRKGQDVANKKSTGQGDAAHDEPLASRAASRACRDRRTAAQSIGGHLQPLALFIWGHMFFVSSILLGKDAM